MPRRVAAAVAAAARRTATDRPGLLMTAAFHLLVVTALGSLWRAAAGTGTLAGYDADALFWYIVASEAATVPVAMRMIERIGDDIADGSIEVELVRPVGVLALRLATELGTTLPRLAVCAVTGPALGLLVTGTAPPAAAVALAAPALVLAVGCNIAAQHAFASLAFAVRDARSAWFLYQKLVFVLGGMLVPLELLPPWLATVARSLPFAAMSYAPARLLSGEGDAWLPAVQVAWLVVLTGLAALGFALGQRRLQRVGA